MKILIGSDFSSIHDIRFIKIIKEIKNIEIITFTMNPNYDRNIYINYKIIPFNKFILNVIPAYFALKHIIKKENINVIYGIWSLTYGLLFALVKTKKLKYILQPRGSDIQKTLKDKKLYRLYLNYVYNKADVIKIDCNYSKVILLKYFPKLIKKKFAIFPNSIIFNEYYNDNQEKDSTITIISTRNFEKVYDVETLIKALSIIKEKFSFNLILCGKGSHYNKIFKLIKENNLEKKIEYKGHVSQKILKNYFNKSHIYISTSKRDGSSNSLLESMACGCIPIVTSYPSNKEWIEDGKNGYLFKISDEYNLAKKIIQCITDRDKWENYIMINKKIIRERANYKANLINFILTEIDE